MQFCLRVLKSQLIGGVFSSIHIREIDMTNSGNYKINKKKRAKSLKDKAKLVMGYVYLDFAVYVSSS